MLFLTLEGVCPHIFVMPTSFFRKQAKQRMTSSWFTQCRGHITVVYLHPSLCETPWQQVTSFFPCGDQVRIKSHQEWLKLNGLSAEDSGIVGRWVMCAQHTDCEASRVSTLLTLITWLREFQHRSARYSPREAADEAAQCSCERWLCVFMTVMSLYLYDTVTGKRSRMCEIIWDTQPDF